MLDVGCLRYLDDEIVVLPTYGWGWIGTAGAIDYALIDAAGAFEIRVDRFFRFRGDLRGVVGIVTASDHLLSGLHIVAAEMVVGGHDFVARLCTRFDLALGTEPPSGDEWPTIMDAALRYQGYGIVAAKRSYIETFLTAQRAKAPDGWSNCAWPR